ncbi:MAG: biotin transporter BioY [Lachnospiraceae bacterium]|nr:biotin transporter BioY [Lachnospiraceae bacterium]
MTTVTAENQKSRTFDMVYMAVFAALMAICSWISIPTVVPFTMQTFALFLAVGVLGGRRGSLTVLLYILLGAVGIPVFAGFQGGISVLMGPSGGYLIGFLFTALAMWAMEKLPGKKTWILAFSMVMGMIIYYVFGTAWFMVVYTKNTGAVALATVLGWCVIPFIIPDFAKIAIALLLSKRLARIIKIGVVSKANV